MFYKLRPVYSNVKSFYGKATVWADSERDLEVLSSYGTDVCRIEDRKVSFLNNSVHFATKTTLRHIVEFLAQHQVNVAPLMKEQKIRSFRQFFLKNTVFEVDSSF